MAYIPPPLPAAPAPAPRGLGLAIAVGSAVAIACAVILGVIGGLADRQFAYGAVLLGVFVGQAVRRVRRDTQAAIAAALISLAGGALASLTGLTVRLVREAHIPLPVVLAHMSTVLSILPRAIGVFGFVCWALPGYAGWADVGRQPTRGARTPETAATAPPGQYYGPGQQPGDVPGAPPDHPGSSFAAPPGPGSAQLLAPGNPSTRERPRLWRSAIRYARMRHTFCSQERLFRLSSARRPRTSTMRSCRP